MLSSFMPNIFEHVKINSAIMRNGGFILLYSNVSQYTTQGSITYQRSKSCNVASGTVKCQKTLKKINLNLEKLTKKNGLSILPY